MKRKMGRDLHWNLFTDQLCIEGTHQFTRRTKKFLEYSWKRRNKCFALFYGL